MAAFPPPIEGIRPTWTVERAGRSVVYLGRFDVFQKGIDDLCDVARAAPEIEFDLYGEPPFAPDARDEFDEVRRRAPENVRFNRPISGDGKRAMLDGSRAYLQCSRFEGFPLAVAEAMAIGVPVFCLERLPFAVEAAGDGAVATLPDDPAAAAERLRSLLADPDALRSLSERGADYIRARTDVEAVAARSSRPVPRRPRPGRRVSDQAGLR